MMEKTVTLKLVRETQNTYLFGELDSQGRPLDKFDKKGAVGTMYVRQHVFNGTRPDEITVTIKTK